MPITLAPRVWAEEIGAALHDETLRTLSATRHGFSTPVFHNDCAPRERRDTGNNDSEMAGPKWDRPFRVSHPGGDAGKLESVTSRP